MDGASPFVTDDGSHSLRCSRFGVSYHSTHGAIQESRHIFIEAGLLPLLEEDLPPTLRIIEMGFGSGLNALLVRQIAQEFPSTCFHYATFELYPIEVKQAVALNYPDLLRLPPALFQQLHRTPWDSPRRLDPNFDLWKRRQDFLALSKQDPLYAEPADLIFYDAFAPENQPELWTVAAMRQCHALLRPGGRLLTYCAKGQFKRNLRKAGFAVEALPGPIGKREITRAIA
ncbi:tRNA U34 5-methylaminomethyl-2-thiouridine-forming methyltransferase MnmC [Lewinella aquimaris]|uniref:tRNA U34 5-methylaminomethyl-2-thiouridine-forming methyltransferase MnmC n=1 Tax=Neolewinella aquimaris TaxID=1835722 RepID=A0A840E5P4_9BACT|nr:tRNA (5-methylaminomethyl-2-thiouridine)(34)-methyltransferase MnmD [Neolewinella aquimaris]MBB4078487.1 tRNA U34 5-methylaminomethyl-2-thiouridine-forming methyltransferase MnmC [Neolewinella aquimaris]